MKRAIITVTLVTLTTALGVTWKQLRAAEAAAGATARAIAENARMKAAIRALEGRLASAERESAGSSVVQPAPAKPSSTTKERENPVDVAAIYRKIREQEKDPKIQSIRLASHRAQLLTTHGALFRKLGLTASEVERFQDIAARREEQNLDLDGVLESEAQQNGTVSPETKRAVEKLRDQVKLEAETARKELLGEERFKALVEYNRTAETRRLVGDMAGAAAVAGIPLTPEQAEQLTQVLANASDGYREGGAAAPWKIDWKRADEQARGILSAPQMEYFQTVTSPLSYYSRFNSRLREAMNEIAKTDAERALATTEKSKGG